MGASRQSIRRGVRIHPMPIRPATWSDLEAVFDLLSARNRATFGISDLQLDHLRIDWELPSFLVGADNWVAETEGGISGYAALGPAQRLVYAAGDPAVGDALFALAVERARARGFDTLQVTAASSDEALAGLARRNGFELETELVRMWRVLAGDEPEPTWPAGVTVSTYEPRDGERLHRLLDEAYSGWDARYVPLAHDDWLKWMTEDAEFDPTVWWLAESDDELVGAALHWRSGWLKDIVVRESARGRGIAKALLQHGFAAFAQRGVPRIGLKVDGNNPTGAVQLYQRQGFVEDRREGIWTLCL